jgi:hypothetical protein
LTPSRRLIRRGGRAVECGVTGVKIAAHSGCGSVVLVDEATEAIAAVEMVVLRQLCGLGLRRMKCESAVGALRVVVLGGGAWDVLGGGGRRSGASRGIPF